MNILIFEYITGGGLVGEILPVSLVKEGELMLKAVTSDFADVENVQVSVLRDYRLQNGRYAENEYIVAAEQSYAKMIEGIAEKIDALLIIAPESDNILSDLCDKYAKQNFILLNSSAEAIALAANKLDTYHYLQEYNIPQIHSYELEEIKSIDASTIIIKPKDGVGCERIRIINNLANVPESLGLEDANNYMVQPYLAGQSASLSLLCWEGKCLVLGANIQNIEEVEDSLELKGCSVNALDRNKFIAFSDELIKCLPGLRGYIGVDILVIEDEILLVDINPRLTTSYVGLRSSIEKNPAEIILHVFLRQQLPEFSIATSNTVNVTLGAECAA